jgi:hypothetical protein
MISDAIGETSKKRIRMEMIDGTSSSGLLQ